jgi:hypothetical protein
LTASPSLPPAVTSCSSCSLMPLSPIAHLMRAQAHTRHAPATQLLRKHWEPSDDLKAPVPAQQ